MDPRIQQIVNQLRNFVEEVQYVPQGAAVPAGFTHTIKLASVANGQDVTIALRVSPSFASVLDLILGFV